MLYMALRRLGRFECFNMWDSKLNIHMFFLLGENKENMRPLVGTSMGVFVSFKWVPMQNKTLIQYVMCQSYSYLL